MTDGRPELDGRAQRRRKPMKDSRPQIALSDADGHATDVDVLGTAGRVNLPLHPGGCPVSKPVSAPTWRIGPVLELSELPVELSVGPADDVSPLDEPPLVESATLVTAGPDEKPDGSYPRRPRGRRRRGPARALPRQRRPRVGDPGRSGAGTRHRAARSRPPAAPQAVKCCGARSDSAVEARSVVSR